MGHVLTFVLSWYIFQFNVLFRMLAQPDNIWDTLADVENINLKKIQTYILSWQDFLSKNWLLAAILIIATFLLAKSCARCILRNFCCHKIFRIIKFFCCGWGSLFCLPCFCFEDESFSYDYRSSYKYDYTSTYIN